MRVIVFFDLPVSTKNERKKYRRFHSFLEKNGYIMMQESVYSKLVLNLTAAEVAKDKIRQAVNGDGIVQILSVTEKQFASIETVIGKSDGGKIISNTDKLVVI